ncbi:hypothetical protein MRS44_004714 [Fusarium solani]|uniref:uncharacterized protein n=1 Tax=Fusarium solani TaxID=169388 RepID=UPI00231834C1|nr:hypothetical protein MRS44_004714 [Fusarium solani]KAJ4230777.1 hypothetical protein NW759_002771 [Fusarium solani]
MSFYGSGYGPPHGYQTSQPYEYPPGQAYAAPPFLTSATLEDQHAAYSHGTVEAYKYNHTAIPGLGMGFSHDTAPWQSAWPHGPVEAQTGPNDPSPMKQTTAPVGLATKDLHVAHNKQHGSGTDDDAMEEGEVSEGELEDIYEPGEVDVSKNGARDPQSLGHKAQVGYHDAMSQIPVTAALPTNASSKENAWNGDQPARDRSGSYSPYLSPREIQSNGLENGASCAHTPRSDRPPQVIELASPNRPQHDHVRDNEMGQTQTSQSDKVLFEFKKRAQDAIVRLWPLNVRYQNYVEEGVDKTVLDQLFMELGLDITTHAPVLEETRVLAAPEAMDTSSNAQDGSSHLMTTSNNDEKSESTDRAKDKSEERKDRIARLLAAKGSKSTATTVDDNKTSKTSVDASATTTISKPEKTKSQSEKSKLIQQKMEALMKAREANAKATQALAPSISVSSSAVAPESSETPRAVSPDAMNLDDQPVAAPDRTDTASAPSIPGLFLSSSAPSPAPNQRKRPVAADLNEQSTAAAQKRPFGQARDSRPFLIDVSDDEDDAEMEIDSPELRPSSIQRPTTPGSRTISFRDHPALPDSASHRAVSSPKAAGTPTSNVNSKVNLENMNKKIEDMRRKIAEAEARKKAKQSNNGSPSLPQSQAQSKEGSVDAASEPTPAVSTPAVSTELGSGAAVGEGRASTPLRRRPSLNALETLPKTRARDQQARPALRARVASERLPILEARRREQTVRLEHLQSEVVRITKEIQDSLAEEERLKQDALQPESEPASRPSEPEPDAIQGEPPDSEHQTRRRSGLELAPELASSRRLISRSAEPVPDLPAADDAVVESPGQNDAIHSSDEADQDASMDESSSSDMAEAAETPEAVQVESATNEHAAVESIADENHHSSTPNTPSSANHTQTPLEGTPFGDPRGDDAELEEDVAMEEVAGDSNDENEVDESSDEYEPTEAGIELPSQQAPSHPQSPASQSNVADDTLLETTDADMQGASATSPIPHAISTGNGELGFDDIGEVNETMTTQGMPETNGPRSSFIPYETPLHYFRAYRFHPQFEDSVSGGLRSLTYSNKIDVKKEVCPDQLTEGSCPRGNECPFQHFEEMQAPDDQILLQLGAYGNYEGEQKQDYVAGLRELLTDFRNRKVKDFQTISQGIIEYRAKFHGDKSKVLPLGGVTL